MTHGLNGFGSTGPGNIPLIQTRQQVMYSSPTTCFQASSFCSNISFLLHRRFSTNLMTLVHVVTSSWSQANINLQHDRTIADQVISSLASTCFQATSFCSNISFLLHSRFSTNLMALVHVATSSWSQTNINLQHDRTIADLITSSWSNQWHVLLIYIGKSKNKSMNYIIILFF